MVLASRARGRMGMLVTDQSDHLVRFSVFDVDLRTGELRRNGSKVRLQEQPFQVLSVLLERPGEVVTREQLRARLWPSDMFVDFDHSLNTAVRRLRDALGDTAENPRFVETVARRGYRFLAPVIRNGSGENTPPARRHKAWMVAGISAAAVLVAGIGIGLRAGGRSLPQHTIQRRLTANPEEDPVTSAVISPNGKYLAFSDRTGFYLEQVDTGETHAVPLPKQFALQSVSWFPDATHGTTGSDQPRRSFIPEPASWFPDSTHLIATWVAGPAEPPGLWEISILGGEPRKLAADAWKPTVSPDGSQIAYLKGSAKGNSEIWVTQASGEEPRRVRASDGSYCQSLAWSPDSRRIAYVRGVWFPGAWEARFEIDVLDLASGKNQLVLANPGLGPGLAWTADGRLMVSIHEPAPNRTDSNLWWTRIDARTLKTSGSLTRLTSQTGGVADVSLSADGKRLAVMRRTIEPDVYVAPTRDRGTRIGELKRLTLDERSDVPYSWTPDGRSVIFISDRYGTFNIFKQAIDQPTPDLLVGGKDQLGIPRLSPDGTEIVYIIQPKVGADSPTAKLMRAPLRGGPPREILEAPGIMNQQCARLPSTLCLYSQVISRSEMRFYTFDLEHGKGHELEKARAVNLNIDEYNWSLSPDGQTLALARKFGPQLEPAILLLSIADGSERTLVLHGWPYLACLDWAADGKSIWGVVSTTADAKTLLNIDLQGRARPVLEEQQMVLGWAIPSPDGRELAIWKASGGSNVSLVEDF